MRCGPVPPARATAHRRYIVMHLPYLLVAEHLWSALHCFEPLRDSFLPPARAGPSQPPNTTTNAKTENADQTVPDACTCRPKTIVSRGRLVAVQIVTM